MPKDRGDLPCQCLGAQLFTLLLVSFLSVWSGWKCRVDWWHGISVGSSPAHKGPSCSSCAL